ncbi:hypothetical protein OG548_44875 [Streptomyces sp. NBC_01356]|uniref:hypothetical protein n=1 Tax=Streptomyces sp. NBC_01356 TaxID=2903836 RepID=UPI002E2FBA74|nr:hypothetical protein [Streptomyces sp. NBC_01356]
MFFTTLIGAVFVLQAPHMAWYINLPSLLVVAVCFLAGTASKKRYVRYLTFSYILLFDFAAPYETIQKDGWTWVVWFDLALLLAVTLVAGLIVKSGLDNASSTRPAPLPTVRSRPVPATRRRPARVAALRRQAERSVSRRR